MNKPKIILVGAGGHCRSCIDVIEQEDRFEILGIIDQTAPKESNTLLGYPIIGTDADLPALKSKCEYAFVTVGQIKSSAVRIRLFDQLKEIGFKLPTIISPLAHVSRHAKIGEGTLVMHAAIVNANAEVGSNCILNTRSLLEHDSHIGDHVHLSTGAIINGASSVGDYSFIGSGAIVVHEVVLPKNSFVRATQLVTSEKDVRVQETH